MKVLKVWNGRGHRKYDKAHIYVAAYSQKQAIELVNEACNCWIGLSEIRNYYSPVWGDNMEGIEPTEPCLYIQEHNKKPIRIL